MVITAMSVVRISASLAVGEGYHKPHSHNPIGVIRYGFIQTATLRRTSTGGQRLSGARETKKPSAGVVHVEKRSFPNLLRGFASLRPDPAHPNMHPWGLSGHLGGLRMNHISFQI